MLDLISTRIYSFEGVFNGQFLYQSTGLCLIADSDWGSLGNFSSYLAADLAILLKKEIAFNLHWISLGGLNKIYFGIIFQNFPRFLKGMGLMFDIPVYNKCMLYFCFTAILTLAIVDLLYGVFVSPFFVENYVNLQWDQSDAYCKFFEFYFTFHDFFVPLVLILLSTYISLKYAGMCKIIIPN